MRIKHIYWFAYFNVDEASVRYRATFPLETLKEQHNISYNIVYPGYDYKNLTNFLITFFSALLFRKKDSLIVFQKIYTKGIYATALKILLFFRPQHTMYDIDDAEHVRQPTDTIHYFMKRCTACSVGSDALITYVKQFNPRVLLLTSPVIAHGIFKTTTNQNFTIGWIGFYGAHRKSLTTLFFPALLNIDFPVTLKILGSKNEAETQEIRNYFSGNRNVTVEAPYDLKWLDELSIYTLISTFDVGVSPLIDDEFNRAKSAFKLKQCMSCGVPVLASSIGENKRFLSNGKNGYFCDTPAEYADKLTLIRQMKTADYNTLSQNAKATFATFSVDYYCKTFLEQYQNPDFN